MAKRSWVGRLAVAVVLATASSTAQDATSLDRLHQNLVKDLSPELPWSAGQRALIAWGYAVQEWMASAPDSGSAQLARGVLLECLASPAQGDGFLPTMLAKTDAEACGYRQATTGGSGMAYTAWREPPMVVFGCIRNAKAAYERALRLDPTLKEAIVRLGSLVLLPQPRSAFPTDDDPRLVRLATERDDLSLAFLASLFLGQAAEKRNNLALATLRYEAARGLNAEWASARYPLAGALAQQGNLDGAREAAPPSLRPDPSDPGYGYSCRILTPDVAKQLREWEAKQAAVR